MFVFEKTRRLSSYGIYAAKLYSYTSLKFVNALRPCYNVHFLSNLSRNAVARQVAGELHSVTWVVSHFFVAQSAARSRTQLYFSQRIAATDNTIAQCIFPSATFLAILRQF